MTVFNEVDGKRVSHMAETHHTDVSEDEFGRPGRLTGISGRCGHVVSRWQEGCNAPVRQLVQSRECRVLGFVEVPPNECLDIGRAIHAREASIEDELGYAGGSVNLDLQDVRLRRKQHPELQLFGGHLASMQR
jgi:hypothetical protein